MANELFISETKLANIRSAWPRFRCKFSMIRRSPSVRMMSTVTEFFCPNRQQRRTDW
jgi:hypothetical protein